MEEIKEEMVEELEKKKTKKSEEIDPNKLEIRLTEELLVEGF